MPILNTIGDKSVEANNKSNRKYTNNIKQFRYTNVLTNQRTRATFQQFNFSIYKNENRLYFLRNTAS